MPRAGYAGLHRLIKERVLPLIPERCHRVGNGFIETAIQRAELICRNVRVPSDGQISNRLANVTIVMDDLINRVSEAKEFRAVLSGGAADVRGNG
jgi:hypothetical protein